MSRTQFLLLIKKTSSIYSISLSLHPSSPPKSIVMCTYSRAIQCCTHYCIPRHSPSCSLSRRSSTSPRNQAILFYTWQRANCHIIVCFLVTCASQITALAFIACDATHHLGTQKPQRTDSSDGSLRRQTSIKPQTLRSDSHPPQSSQSLPLRRSLQRSNAQVVALNA